MKLIKLLTMFGFLSSAIFGADLYLTSQDGLPMKGFEFQDMTVTWQHARELAPVAVNRGYPVAQYKSQDYQSGWAYDFSQNRREIRAAYRKANRIAKTGRPTVVLVTEPEWCIPCRIFEKGEVWKWVKSNQDCDSETSAMDSFPAVKSIPTLIVVNADNKELLSIPANEASIEGLKSVINEQRKK